MADEHQTGAGQPSGQSVSSSQPDPATTRSPAEEQFPYLVTHGLQSSTPAPPSLNRRGPRRAGRQSWLPLAMAAGLFALAVIATDLAWGPRPLLGPRSDAAATQAVRGYLEALAKGDATAALGYALRSPSDPSLLTDQVLAEQRATVPISDIAVSAPNESGRVPASYLLGTERVSTVFELTLDGDAWRLDRVAATVDLSSFVVPVALNDAVPQSARPELFPGRYRVTSSAARYSVPDVELDILHPFEQPAIQGSLQLSETGRAEVIDAAEAHLADCLSRHDLEPPGCGFGVVDPDQTPLDESTVEWRADGAADFAGLVISLDHAGSASADIDLTVQGDVHGLDGSRWEAHVQLTRMRADLTGPMVRVQFG
ncbi:MAG: hypothetical protein KIT69_18245 [Propionibacteriaceae bacterium]|nr:hypothetical protein [Propionibacteriaceae bacterium]